MVIYIVEECYPHEGCYYLGAAKSLSGAWQIIIDDVCKYRAIESWDKRFETIFITSSDLKD